MKIVQERRENKKYKAHMQMLVKEKTKDLEENYKKMRELLAIDGITQIPNISMLYQYLDFYQDELLSIFLIRIDNLNYFSQVYSKKIYNDILKNTAKYINLNLPSISKSFRYSEDEFVVICENPTLENMRALAQQLNAFFKETAVAESEDGNDIYVTLSIAIVQNEDKDTILQKAKATLNELTKSDIVGYCKVYEKNASYIQGLKTENKWFEKIRQTIEDNHLIPYFHPIVDTNTGEIVRYECLARADEDGEIISPASFLESVKKSGLMRSLSRIMINKCFQMCAHEDLHISLNITNEDLLDEQFADFVITKQKQYAVEPSKIMFEILEDIILGVTDSVALRNLMRLKEHGFLLALDDFGSDRSNLSRFVSLLHIDYLKIDGQFIKGIDKNRKHCKIVSSIVALAHELGIKIVAEYVSTKEEFEVAKELGIEYCQGYYFYQPAKEI